MKIDSEPLEDHQIKLTVSIDPDQFDGVKRQAARKISRRTKIPGFRPGKAPFPVVQRHVGEAAVLEEALDLLIDDIYPKVIDESDINPFGPGSLEKINSTDPPVLEFVVPLAPEVALGDYQKITITYEPEALEEEEIGQVLKQVQENQAIVEPVERPAAIGDIVYLVVSGKEVNTAPVAAGEDEGEKDPVSIREQRLNFLIRGEDDQDEEEWPFPGFSRELVGLEAGSEKTIAHTYPEDYNNETFSGLTIEFQISVEEIKSRELPPLDDTLAQSVGDYEDIGELKDYIKETLSQNKLEAYHSEYDDKVLEELIESSSIHYPPQMVQQELSVVLDQLKDRLASQGLDLDIYLKTRDMDQEALDEELRPTAVRRIKRGLVLFELAKAEGLEVDPQEVEQEVSRTVNQIFQVMPEKEARQRLSGDAVQNLVGQIMSDKLAQLALKRLRAIASGGLSTADNDDAAESDEAEASAESLPVEPDLAEGSQAESAKTAEAAPEAGAMDPDAPEAAGTHQPVTARETAEEPEAGEAE